MDIKGSIVKVSCFVHPTTHPDILPKRLCGVTTTFCLAVVLKSVIKTFFFFIVDFWFWSHRSLSSLRPIEMQNSLEFPSLYNDYVPHYVL